MLPVSVAAWLCIVDASAGEVCRFEGTTDYAGHVAVTTDVTGTGVVTKIDVTVKFEAAALWLGIHYLIEEISTWRAGELQSLAVNNRYFIGDHIVRQQWDKFERGPDGLEGERVQAKTLAELRRSHSGFVQYWDPATFGAAWLPDYQLASPKRRPDLDLKSSPLPSGLRSPFAMAFYWVRWLPAGGRDVPVFLPGFKADKLVHLPITAVSSGTGTLWRAPLHYPALSETPASAAVARTSPDRHLLRLAFELHGSAGSARGLIRQQGCEGAPVVPAGAQR